MRFPAFFLSVAVLLFGVVYTAPHDRAYAQSSSPLPGMSAAIAATVSANAVANGFSLADPRIAQTVAAIGSQAAAVAGAVAAGAGVALASIPWIGVGVAAGIGVFLPGDVGLGKDTLDQWQFNKDGSVTVASAAGSSPFPSLAAPNPFYCTGQTTSTGVGSACGSTPAAACQAFAQYHNGINGYTVTVASSTSGSCTFQYVSPSGAVSNAINVVTGSGSGVWSGSTCASGVFVSGACASYSGPAPAPVTESPLAAAAATSAGDEQDALNSQVLAALVNALWSDAAQGEGYSGLPFPVNAPVLPSQAATAESDLGTSAPTVGSVVGGAGSLTGASSAAPFATSPAVPSNPASAVPATPSSTAVPTATNPGSGAQVNLGPDPGIGLPGLEAIPTAAQILAPILGLLPDLRAWTVPTHTAQCPEPSFELWGTTYTISTQCDLLNQYGSQIYAAFALAFTMAGLFIVLSA